MPVPNGSGLRTSSFQKLQDTSSPSLCLEAPTRNTAIPSLMNSWNWLLFLGISPFHFIVSPLYSCLIPRHSRLDLVPQRALRIAGCHCSVDHALVSGIWEKSRCLWPRSNFLQARIQVSTSKRGNEVGETLTSSEGKHTGPLPLSGSMAQHEQY